MIDHIVLDSSPLGLATNPKGSEPALECAAWLTKMRQAGKHIYIPEVADYEIRRELIRVGSTRGLKRLDEAKAKFDYLAITTTAMLLAAELWARARSQGIPTADPRALDVDVILAAQALTLALPEGSFVIATENVGHLSRFVPAARWQDIE